jgi:hypothetical protein
MTCGAGGAGVALGRTMRELCDGRANGRALSGRMRARKGKSGWERASRQLGVYICIAIEWGVMTVCLFLSACSILRRISMIQRSSSSHAGRGRARASNGTKAARAHNVASDPAQQPAATQPPPTSGGGWCQFAAGEHCCPLLSISSAADMFTTPVCCADVG